MTTITKKEFKELANKHGLRCASIFLPTHRGGEEVLNRKDAILLKNLLGKIEPEMVERGFSEKEATEILEPAYDLLEDGAFWRNRTEGLAIYLSRDVNRMYDLPFRPDPYHYLSHEFYLKPMLPILMDQPAFYLLTLNFQGVKFFKGNRNTLEEVSLDESLPQRIEEVVGADYEQKFLGFHTQRGARSEAIFHGHGEGNEDRREEVLSFLRAIDKEVSNHLAGTNMPLLVASLDHLFPMYEQANTYTHLFPKNISGNPEDVEPPELHRKAADLIRETEFEKVKQEKKDLFLQFHGTERASAEIRDIVPAAINGRIDTLFLDKDREFWGIYDKRDASVRLNDEQHLSNTSLTNMMAVSTFLNGGMVFLEETDEMPFPESGVNALYRY